MRYVIQDGKGGQYSAGAGTCDGREHIDPLADAGKHSPSKALIHLDADPGVANGWAALTSP